MTSKEAFKILLENLKITTPIKCIQKIEQDLDRLEKLEKFVDIYKHTNQRFTMMVQAPYTDLPYPTLEQELLRVEVLEHDK